VSADTNKNCAVNFSGKYIMRVWMYDYIDCSSDDCLYSNVFLNDISQKYSKNPRFQQTITMTRLQFGMKNSTGYCAVGPKPPEDRLGYKRLSSATSKLISKIRMTFNREGIHKN